MLAGYLRVSRVGDRAERLISPEEQEGIIREYCRAHGREVHIFAPELDVSGAKRERPILGEILAGCHSGRFEGVIVAWLDRLSRLGLADALGLIEEIEGAGAEVIAVRDNYDASTPEGELGRNVTLSIGRMQRRRSAERFAAAKVRAVEHGIWPLPIVPIGYRKGPERRLVPSADAPRVRRAYERRLAGDPWRVIGEILGRGASGARRAIGNRVYLGEINYAGARNPNAHRPLIDAATFEACQVSSPRKPRGQHNPLLAGILRCARCRGLLSYTVQTGRWRGYRCHGHRADGVCPERAMIAASVIEPYLQALVIEGLRSYVFTERDRHGEIDRARVALAGAEAELDAYSQAVDASRLGVELVAEGLRSRAARIEEARQMLGEARRLRPLESGFAAETFPSLSVEARRHLLGRLGVVWVRKGRGPAPGRVRISGAVPDDLPRPGLGGRRPILPIVWEDIKEPPWVIEAKRLLKGSG